MKELITIKQIEGLISPHHEYTNRELEKRKEALEYINDLQDLANYIGGKVEKLNLGEDWVISKEIFPNVNLYFVYMKTDEDFLSEFKVLFSGNKVKKLQGEDLASLTIACVNHILRYIKETSYSKKLPDICNKV
ncbi:DUF3786 domain-containing protein [bacterium]|nr:DUF3786 domain-containing protein [bacterium]